LTRGRLGRRKKVRERDGERMGWSRGQWKGIGDGAYGVQAGAARGDNDVHMKMDTDMGMGTGTGMGSGMDRGMGIDIGLNGMHRDPPLQWQQFDWSAQVGRRSTLRTEDDEWKRFWQRKNNG
jgi:hypothetical protein